MPSNLKNTQGAVATFKHTENMAGITIESAMLYNRDKTTVVNFDTNGNKTLTDLENTFGRIVLTDDGGVLTTGRELIVSDTERFLTVVNKTGFDITVKTSVGTGVTIYAGHPAKLIVDGTYVVNNEFEIGVNQKWINVMASRNPNQEYENDTGRPIVASLGAGTSQNQPFYVDGEVVGRNTSTGVSTPWDITIPIGSSYKFSDSSDTSMAYWSELR